MKTLFDTERLTVRHFCSFDTAACESWLSDPEVMRWIEEPFDHNQIEEFLNANAFLRQPRIYAIQEKESGNLAGHLIFHPWDENGYELGWILKKDVWHRGYASELTQAAVSFAAEKGIRKLIIECDRRQQATVSLAEHSGFVLSRTDGNLLCYRREIG